MGADEEGSRMEDSPVSESTNDDLSGGVQAVETGMRVLSALIELGPTPMLKTIAEKAGMPPPKAHRYLTSYCRSGLVERNAGNGGYRLGPLAVRLGLAALRHLDVVTVATPALGELRDELGFSCALAVWGTLGPTYVRVEEADSVFIISLRAGSVMPILTSATGRVFGAFLPPSQVEPLIKAELAGTSPLANDAHLARRMADPMTRQEAEQIFRGVREHGVATVSGDVNIGIHGLAAPVFDHEHKLVGTLTVFGSPGLIDITVDGHTSQVLRDKAAQVSNMLGCT